MKTLLINTTAENVRCLSTFNNMYTDVNYTNLFSIRSKAFVIIIKKTKDTLKLFDSFLSLLHFEKNKL